MKAFLYPQPLSATPISKVNRVLEGLLTWRYQLEYTITDEQHLFSHLSTLIELLRMKT